MKELEEASEELWQELEDSPGASPLRERFNFMVEYVSTSLLFLVACPGELANCTYKELTDAEAVQDGLHVLVSKHKTGRFKKAVIEIPAERKELFFR